MFRLSIMASLGYPPASGLIFHPEQGLNRAPKDCLCPLPNLELRRNITRSSPLGMRQLHTEEPWKSTSGLYNNNQFVKIDPTVTRPILFDVQDASINSIRATDSFRKHDEIYKFLMSSLSEAEGGLDLPTLSDLMALKCLTINHISRQLQASDYHPCYPEMTSLESQIICPSYNLDSPKSLVDFVGNLVHCSEIAFNDDGLVSLPGVGSEMKDILSILAEFFLVKESTKWRSQSILVPQFDRLDFAEPSYYGSLPMGVEAVTVAPLKSPEKVKVKSAPQKKGNRSKAIKEKDLPRTNYLQACESLLSIIVDKKRNGKAAIPVLKKSGSELPNLLTQFSASIAGTGLAMLFSVALKVGSGRVPLCASKLLNTGLGLGLVWLSWAINRLRDTIISIGKNSNKKGLKEAEMMKKLDTSMKQIYFRAATVMVVVMLRFA